MIAMPETRVGTESPSHSPPPAGTEHGLQVSISKVRRDYGAVGSVDDVSLAIGKGEFVSLLGPSGSGKTTLLMMLAGFEQPTSGNILLDGTAINHVPTHKRDMGVVFQSYALFPHMSVGENVAFPLQMRGLGKAEIDERV